MYMSRDLGNVGVILKELDQDKWNITLDLMH